MGIEDVFQLTAEYCKMVNDIYVYFWGKVISTPNLLFYLFFQHKAVISSYLQVVSAIVKLPVIHILCELLTRTIYYCVDCGAISP